MLAACVLIVIVWHSAFRERACDWELRDTIDYMVAVEAIPLVLVEKEDKR